MLVRYVTCNDDVSLLIRAREGELAPYVGFTPSHVELVVKNADGSHGYLGAHGDGGIKVRPIGYDKATLAHELFVEVPLAAEAAALAFAWSKLNAPYDWLAIAEFLLPFDLHEPRHFICSAYVTLVMVKGGKFPGRLAKRIHTISPANNLFLISGLQPIVPAAGPLH